MGAWVSHWTQSVYPEKSHYSSETLRTLGHRNHQKAQLRQHGGVQCALLICFEKIIFSMWLLDFMHRYHPLRRICLVHNNFSKSLDSALSSNDNGIVDPKGLPRDNIIGIKWRNCHRQMRTTTQTIDVKT